MEDPWGYDEAHAMAGSPTTLLSSAALRARFDEPAPLTVGLEEEIMVLDAATLDLAPRGMELVGGLVEPEMPAAQVELASDPCTTVDAAIAGLAAGRRELADRAAPLGLALGCAGTHPFAAAEGELNRGPRYDAIEERYGSIARRQLVFALQVHVCVRPAGRALAVYNALRGYLPELAALAACAPFHDGRDTGLASMRPLIGTLLPRQGVPPALASWDAFADGLRWAGDPASWWWELRPHHVHGTLELRVPDAQPTLADARAVAAVAHALTGWLAERLDAGETLPVPETWRIAENRWSALRHGLAGEMADLETGEREPTADRVAALLDAITPTAERLGCAAGVAAARILAGAGGGAAKLRVAADGDVRSATAWLAARFLDGV
ncbi:MAG: YbdK family carboxylate-amine ligase [Solirubrobacteraceae bacterium]